MFHPLALTLDLAVPLHIAELRKRGGPTTAEIEDIRSFSQTLAEKGDVLMFGGKKGEAADLFNKLAKAIAICAFQPGGITLFERTWIERRRPRRRI